MGAMRAQFLKKCEYKSTNEKRKKLKFRFTNILMAFCKINILHKTMFWYKNHFKTSYKSFNLKRILWLFVESAMLDKYCLFLHSVFHFVVNVNMLIYFVNKPCICIFYSCCFTPLVLIQWHCYSLISMNFFLLRHKLLKVDQNPLHPNSTLNNSLNYFRCRWLNVCFIHYFLSLNMHCGGFWGSTPNVELYFASVLSVISKLVMLAWPL